ncbi:MAG: helix-turn-helix transcriptional regulator [Oscillospiraceae bacterium]
MEIYQAVGQNIHRLRKAQQLSIDRAAALSGVSKSMLGQIERGLVNPTVSVLAPSRAGCMSRSSSWSNSARRPRRSCTGRSTSSARGSAAGRSSAIRSSL